MLTRHPYRIVWGLEIFQYSRFDRLLQAIDPLWTTKQLMQDDHYIVNDLQPRNYSYLFRQRNVVQKFRFFRCFD